MCSARWRPHQQRPRTIPWPKLSTRRWPTAPCVDKGSAAADGLVARQRESGVASVGPVAADPSGQARPDEGCDTSRCLVDGDRHLVTWPAGQQTISWGPNTDPQKGLVWEVRVARKAGTPCLWRSPCTKARPEPRLLGRQAREPHEARQAARQRQTTQTFRRQYAARAGIEGTHDHAMRRWGLRRRRYLGLANTPLPHLMTATAVHMVRVTAWLEETPRAKTRRSAVAMLAA
jgi:transposase